MGKQVTLSSKELDKQGSSAGKDELGEVTAESRFSFQIEGNVLEQYKEGEVPENTAKNTEWSYRNFESWQTANNKKILISGEKCLTTFLFLLTKTTLVIDYASL